MTKIKLASTPATKHLFDKISDPYLKDLKVDLFFKRFENGELDVRVLDSVRGAYVYLFASNSRDNEIVELILTLGALKRASARKVILVLPNYGYGRQDKKTITRSTLGARDMADIITFNGVVERIISFDLHANQIQLAFAIPVEHMFGHTIFLRALEPYVTERTKICAPDTGAMERNRSYAEAFGKELVSIYKYRKEANKVESMMLLGDVDGSDVIMVDDMGDTLGTMVKSSQLLKDSGARSITYAFTHPFLSGAALENIERSAVDRILMSDTIYKEVNSPKVQIVSCISVIEKVIHNLIDGESVSKLNDPHLYV